MTRIRLAIHGVRVVLTVRLPSELHPTLLQACVHEQTAITAFVTHALELALARADPCRGLSQFVVPRGHTGTWITTTLRVPPELKSKIQAAAAQCGLTMNMFITAVVSQHLRRHQLD